MNFEKFEIALVATNRERAWPGCLESATYTFVITDGFLKARAEVMLSDGCLEIIEQGGNNSKAAAKLALEHLLVADVTLFKLRSSFRLGGTVSEILSKGPRSVLMCTGNSCATLLGAPEGGRKSFAKIAH